MRDAVVGARAQVVATLTLVLVLATVCFAILVTTGQAAANEARVVAQIDSAGTRLIALSDDGGVAGILPTAPSVLAGISDVSWALGLGAAVDVKNPALPDGRAASRAMVGGLPADVGLVQGRRPHPGEAVAGAGAAAALDLGPGLGRVQTVDQPQAPEGWELWVQDSPSAGRGLQGSERLRLLGGLAVAAVAIILAFQFLTGGSGSVATNPDDCPRTPGGYIVDGNGHFCVKRVG
jgi:hypothetical protein